jgi:AMIN domain
MKTNWPAMRIGCLIVASAALSSSPSLAQTKEPAGATAASVISSVAITQAPQRASVRVEGEGPLEVHATRVQDPDRLVLDFSATKLAVHKTVIPGVSAPVRGVRLGQFRPDVARVVVDLTAASPYQISRDGVSVVVSFENAAQSPAASAPILKAASEKIPPERPAFRYDVSGPHSAASSGKIRKISAPRFALPGELTQPSVVLASFGGTCSSESAAGRTATIGQRRGHGGKLADAGNRQIHWRAHLCELEGRRPKGLLSTDSRN